MQPLRLPKETNKEFGTKGLILNAVSYKCKPHSIKGHDLPRDTEETVVMLMPESDQVVSP